MKSTTLLAIILTFLLISSCSITERRYMTGYHIEWPHTDPPVSNLSVEKNKIQQTQKLSISTVASHPLTPDLQKNIPLASTSLSFSKVNKNKIALPIPINVAFKNVNDTLTRVIKPEKSYKEAKTSMLLAFFGLLIPFVLLILGTIVLNGAGS